MRNGTRNRLLVVVAFAIILLILLVNRSGGERTKLPTGPITPMVSIGMSHGVILAGDGSLWSWGTNFLGPVLGLSNVTETPFLRRIGKDTNWVSVSAGWMHNVAIKSDGTLWAWGRNYSGEFGTSTRGVPQSSSVPMIGPPGHDWKAAAAGNAHTLALKKDGTLWSWGNNAYGQLGIGTTNNFSGPTQIGSETNWTRIWAGYNSSAAQQANGSLWVWGTSPDLKQKTFNSNNLLSPIRISPDTNWVAASIGLATLLAIKNDGTLWTWGGHAPFYLGTTNLTANTILRQVGTNTDWQSLSASWDARHHLLTKKDGTLWTLFDPDDPPPGKEITFIRGKLDKQFVAVGAGHDLGVALTSNGEVWTWGHALGQDSRAHPFLQKASRGASLIGLNIHWGDSQPVYRDAPWLLPNIDPDAPRPK